MRTATGGTDALKRVLVDLKRYAFSGYVKTILPQDGDLAMGYVVVADGNPEIALHGTGGKQSEGKVALRAVWQDSYAESCSIEIHAKVDIEAIRKQFPKARIERTRRAVRKVAKAGEADLEAKVNRWKDAGYDVRGLHATARKGGEGAARALADYEAGVAKMDPLRQALDNIDDPPLRKEVESLREAARDPKRFEEVAKGLARVQEERERLHQRERLKASAEAQEAELQARARQVFEMIVRHRAAEGKPADISERQVAEAIEGRPPTRDERTNLIGQYTFDTFLVGPSNRFAHAASLAVAKKPHHAYNPLFITSGPGLGKTHLLNAIGNHILAEDGASIVVYATAEGFSNEFKEARSANKLPEFREKYRTVDVALFDDAQFLSGKGDVQEELFHTFNDLYTANKQIVLTSDRPPKEIPDLEDRLVSRFESGLIADIQPPEYETRVAILRQKARDDRVDVDEEVIAFIGRRVESNIRELLGALNRVIAFSTLMGQPVSLDLAKEVLKDLAEVEAAEGAKVAVGAEQIQPGRSYLVEEDRPEHAFRILNRAVEEGGRSLVITRSNPRRIREKHSLSSDRTIWLTERESSSVETIPPSLERIVYVIEEFMKEGGPGAILLDGVEYLVSSNSFDAVLKFLRRLIDHTSESPFVLLVSVSTKTMKEQEIKNLEREMDVLSF